MFKLGTDVGSTYTKYCILSEDNRICECFSERTPVRQKEFFEEKMAALRERLGDFTSVSCGYGKANIPSGAREINELTALATGTDYVCHGQNAVLDIGGQDTKLIWQENGKLKDFFINDKCAAGSGMFLINTLRLLEMDFADIDLGKNPSDLQLSSSCAVFAQTEIVELIAANISAEEIVKAVIRQILVQSKALLGKINIKGTLLLSGGLTEIKGIKNFSEELLGVECVMTSYGKYIAAIGCALSCEKDRV